MEADSGKRISVLKADGGAAANAFLMQFQADISAMEVQRPLSKEATSLGAAFLAGLTAGFFESKKEVLSLCRSGKGFRPEMKDDRRKELLDGWYKAVGRVRL